MIRHISLDTEFLEAGRHPETQAAQILLGSIALVDVFGRHAFYGVHEVYTPERVTALLEDKRYSTLPAEDPDLAARLLSFQRGHVLPKLFLDEPAANSISGITIDGKNYTLDYRVGPSLVLGDAIIDFLKRTKTDESTLKLWAHQGSSDQIMIRSPFNGLLSLRDRLDDIGLTLQAGEIKDLVNPNPLKVPEDLSHNCLYDAAYDAHNIRIGLVL